MPAGPAELVSVEKTLSLRTSIDFLKNRSPNRMIGFENQQVIDDLGREKVFEPKNSFKILSLCVFPKGFSLKKVLLAL